MPHHSSRKQMIFVGGWQIVALLSQPHSVLDFCVHTRNLPSSKSVSSDPWEDFSDLFREGRQPLPRAWAEVFGPLRVGAVDELVIVGQIGQSLDGRIATESGHSKYINGPGGLDHLVHRIALIPPMDGPLLRRQEGGDGRAAAIQDQAPSATAHLRP